MAQRPRQLVLSGRGIQQIGTAHDVGHPLQGVVHHHGQLIGPRPVGAADDEVAHLVRHVLRLGAEPAVREGFDPREDEESPRADGRGRSRCARPCRGLWRPAGSGIGALRKHPPRAAACIEAALALQPGERLFIVRGSGALPNGRRIPVQAQGLQLLQDQVIRPGHHARPVDVFDAQQPAPVMGARIQEAGQRGHQRAGMQGPAGAWRKAPDIHQW